MTINTDALLNKTMLNTLATTTSAVSDVTADFKAELQRQLIENLQSQKKVEEVQSDAALEEFKQKLTSMGALGFLQSYNLEKIEALMEKKKAELMESLGLSESTQPPLSAQERKSALETLDDLLADYRKELLEKMQAEDKLEKNNTVLSAILKQF